MTRFGLKRIGLKLVIFVVLPCMTVVFAFRMLGWSTVCQAVGPNGRRAVVTCHRVPTVIADARYHYYLEFEPAIQFRPERREFTLKQGGSAVKPWARVQQRWSTRHYMGYLQGFDCVEDRAPTRIEWSDENVVLYSRRGIAGEVRVR